MFILIINIVRQIKLLIPYLTIFSKIKLKKKFYKLKI